MIDDNDKKKKFDSSLLQLDQELVASPEFLPLFSKHITTCMIMAVYQRHFLSAH